MGECLSECPSCWSLFRFFDVVSFVLFSFVVFIYFFISPDLMTDPSFPRDLERIVRTNGRILVRASFTLVSGRLFVIVSFVLFSLVFLFCFVLFLILILAVKLDVLCSFGTSFFSRWLLPWHTTSLAKWLRRPPRKRKVRSSNPACDGIFFRVESYQWFKNLHSSGYRARRLAL